MKLYHLITIGIILMSNATDAQKNNGFKWVNPLPEKHPPRLTHATFTSTSMNTDIGYVIYLPPGYEKPENQNLRYPVVYYLHGGRPGSELKSINLARHVHRAIRTKKMPPTIYVYINGGRMSHYDYKKWLGETAFVKELIPHVDQTYRTISDRLGRGIEGFSQGGRGTARIMFKYPELFGSAAPMGGGQQHEKRISENNGKESKNLVFAPPTNNTWDLAREFAKNKTAPQLNILIVVGTKDFNYEPNLEWMAHLDTLKIPYKKIIVEDVPHSANQIYKKVSDQIFSFHTKNLSSQ